MFFPWSFNSNSNFRISSTPWLSRPFIGSSKIQALCALPLTCSTYEELAHALEQQSRTSFQNNVPIELLKLNYKLLAGFLYQKTVEAERKGITLSISIQNFALQTIVPEYELLEMTGILLDNAIEATAESEIIKVSIDSYQAKVVLPYPIQVLS